MQTYDYRFRRTDGWEYVITKVPGDVEPSRLNPDDVLVDATVHKPSPSKSMNTHEPPPEKNTYPSVWHLVMKDMIERDVSGREKYGTPLQPHNGRNALIDAYQEALDLAVYLRQKIYEESGK